MDLASVPPDEVQFDPSSFTDNSGRLFIWSGELYRAITSRTVDRYRTIITDGFVERLVSRGLLIETEIVPLALDGFEMVLKHRRLPFVTYEYEWCGEMMKEAALTVLELERELSTRHLTLKDPHNGNVLFDGPQPLFVDFGSIVLWPKEQPWIALEAFCRFFLFPLELMARGHGRIARALIFQGGVEERELDAILGDDDDHPRAPDAEGFPDRQALTESLQERVKAIDVSSPQTEWADYYDYHDEHTASGRADRSFPPFTPTEAWSNKHRSVHHILQQHRPESVLDIGSNRGWYAQLAARNGSKVVAVDVDEACMNQLYREARSDGLSVIPLVMNFAEPFRASLGQLDVTERLRCDLVIALALVHHLVFPGAVMDYARGGGLTFDHIVPRLATFTRRRLAVEFIPKEDDYVRTWPTDHAPWYTLDNFKESLGHHFDSISEWPSHPEPRVILLCEKS